MSSINCCTLVYIIIGTITKKEEKLILSFVSFWPDNPSFFSFFFYLTITSLEISISDGLSAAKDKQPRAAEWWNVWGLHIHICRLFTVPFFSPFKKGSSNQLLFLIEFDFLLPPTDHYHQWVDWSLRPFSLFASDWNSFIYNNNKKEKIRARCVPKKSSRLLLCRCCQKALGPLQQQSESR